MMIIRHETQPGTWDMGEILTSSGRPQVLLEIPLVLASLEFSSKKTRESLWKIHVLSRREPDFPQSTLSDPRLNLTLRVRPCEQPWPSLAVSSSPDSQEMSTLGSERCFELIDNERDHTSRQSNFYIKKATKLSSPHPMKG